MRNDKEEEPALTSVLFLIKNENDVCFGENLGGFLFCVILSKEASERGRILVKIVLIALNARYSHSNPALRYLKNACASNTDWQCEWLEWSINGILTELVEALIATAPQAVGFSCYI